MRLPDSAPERRMRVASAAALTTGRNGTAQQQGPLTSLPWQQQSLALYKQVPEFAFAANFYARMLSKVRIYAAAGDSFAHAEEIKTGEPVDMLKRIQDPGGGHSQLLYRYGELMWLTGEGYLFGQGVDTGPGRWSFVWRDELQVMNGKVTHVLRPGLTQETLTLKDDNYQSVPAGSCVAYRMWTPDPQYSGLPNAPMRAVLDVGRELLALTQSVMATATSRLARAPLLILPNDLTPPPAEAIGDEDPLNDPLLADLVAHMRACIENPGTAEALVPFFLWGASDYLGPDMVRTIKLHDSETDYLERDLRDEAIKRLGYGLDLPSEVIQGMTRANHWSAAIVSDAMWSDHGDPKIRQFCSDLTDAYLRPALESVGYSDPESVIVAYDASQVTINPDRSDDANEAWDRGAIGYEEYRKMKAIPEDSGQTPEEHAEWLTIKVPQRYTQPDSAQAAPTDVQVPERKPADTRSGEAAKVASGAASLALLRCRELAGVRLRREEKYHPQLFAAVNGAPDSLVPSLLGEKALQQLQDKSPDDLGLLTLVANGTDGFRALLTEWGYGQQQIDAACSMIELHAARTLAQPALPDLPAGLTAQLAKL